MTYCNPYMEKIAETLQAKDLQDYVDNYVGYQEPIISTALKGASYGVVGGTAYGLGKALPYMKEMAMLTRGNDQTYQLKAINRVNELASHYGRRLGLSGAGAGLVYGAYTHAKPHMDYKQGNSEVEGALEYSSRHVDPYVGKLLGGFVGSTLASKLKIPGKIGAHELTPLIVGATGAAAGAGLGSKGVSHYNQYVINDILKRSDNGSTGRTGR